MRIHLDDCCGLYRLTGVVLHSKQTVGPAVIAAFQKRMFTGEAPAGIRDNQGYLVNNGVRIPFAPYKKPLVVFTDAVEYGRGTALKEYIEKNNLGTVTASKPVHNLNSDHLIQGFFWEVNYETLENWKYHGLPLEKEVIGSDIGMGDAYRHRQCQKEDNECAVVATQEDRAVA